MNARATVIYSGQVQGVGFRATARSIASGRPVSGQVRNLGNGDVELIAEGDRDAVRELLDAVADRFGRRITDARVTWGAATGGFDGFRVSR